MPLAPLVCRLAGEQLNATCCMSSLLKITSCLVSICIFVIVKPVKIGTLIITTSPLLSIADSANRTMME